MKSIVITGGTGFIGSNLTRRLLGDGHKIHFLVRPNYKEWRIGDIKNDIVLHKVTLSDRKQIQELLEEIHPDWIFHLASYGGHASQRDVQKMIETNIEGTHSLLEGGLKVGFQSFINIGSSSEYGFKDHAPSEEEWLDPNSDYASTKAYATMFCRYVALSNKANLITLRPYSVFGPYEEPTKFLPTLIVSGLEGKLPPLVSADTARDYIYIDDFVEACVLAARKTEQEAGSIYNAGTGVQITVKEAVELAKDTLKISDEPKWGSMENHIWDTNIWVSDSSRIQKILGWHAKHSFSEGFKKTISWFKNNPSILELYQKAINLDVG